MFRLRRSLAAAVATVALALGGVLGAGSAWADPTPSSTPPTDDDVRAAQRAVQDAARSVNEMEAELAGLQAQTEQAQIAVQKASEDYSDAVAAKDAAAAEAATAASDAETAATAATSARSQLGAVYRASVQQSGQSDLVSTLVGASDVQALVDRDSALRVVGNRTQTTVDESATAQALAQSSRARADAAAAVETERTQQADAALVAAQQAQADLDAQTAAASTRHDQLVAQLAAAQQTSVEVEAARQAAILAEQQRQREEAARQQRLAEQAAAERAAAPPRVEAPPAGGGSSGSGGGSTGSGGGSSGSGGGAPATGKSSAAQGQAAVDWARTKLGAPYVWAGTGPGYDCSGLTSRAWASAGIDITRTSRSQYLAVGKVPYSQMRPGDLIFYATNTSQSSTIYHVAMYIGDGKMIEAPAPGLTVRIVAVKWTNSMPYAGRP